MTNTPQVTPKVQAQIGALVGLYDKKGRLIRTVVDEHEAAWVVSEAEIPVTYCAGVFVPMPVTDTMVEAAAKTLCRVLREDRHYTDDEGDPLTDPYEDYHESGQAIWREQAKAILTAALSPTQPETKL